ncbi:MAG TPA: SGNH/GDSL hydrolase family protein [Verrucomicrobiae bacterium]|nr:SGNH/GDSL hydrolase family protein [Verrucomicrobiae bacterium]
MLLAIGLAPISDHAWSQARPAENPFEKEIQAFEAADRTNPPATGAILFVGSSSIRKWTTLSRDFSGLKVINRGFGGSQIVDSTFFADRIIVPYAPKLIVMFAGDNDLAAGKTPERIFGDYEGFVRKIHERLPETRILYISIKPSPSRWELKDEQIAANQEIAALKDPLLDFVDVYPAMLGSDGKPRPELFVKDGLHLSEAGYALWTRLIKPRVEALASH